MKIIAITGIDGTGKTTLAKNLVIALNKKGIKTTGKYGRIAPVLSRIAMSLGRGIFLRKEDANKEYLEYDKAKAKTMQNPILALIYSLTIFVDYYIQLWIKLGPYILSNRVIILDRYIYDTVISDLTVHLDFTLEQNNRTIHIASRFVPKPVIVIVLDAPEDIAFARKDDVIHIEYLRVRREWYIRLKEVCGAIVLDSTQEPQELVAQTERIYFEKINRKNN